MSPLAILLAIGTVAGMAGGQVLFKFAAANGSLADILLSKTFWAAVCLYGLVTLLWVMLLREVELSRAYPIMAATYVLVPFASVFLFGDKLGASYILGIVLIVAGIVLTVRA